MRRVVAALAFLCLLTPLFSSAATCLDLSRTLAPNSKGADVSKLQEFLRDNAGYGGAISGNLGPLSVAALTRWQIYKGIIPAAYSPGAGTTGPKTRAALACTSTPKTTTTTTTNTTSSILSRTLTIGARGTDVTALQTLLKSSGFLSAEATGYFGTQTKAAVIAYQRANSLEQVGIVGPKTRALLNTQTGTIAPAPRPSPSPSPPPPPPPQPAPSPSPVPPTPAATCSWDGKTIAHGSKVTAYQKSSVPFGQTCTPKERTCQDGQLTGTEEFAACTVGAAAACVLNGTTVAHGTSRTFYSAAGVAFGQQCEQQTRTCTNSQLSGENHFEHSSCAVGTPTSCSFNGAAVAHGAPVTAYQAASVPFGQTCTSQSRACSNGTLSGSYQFASCAPAPQAATFTGSPLSGETPLSVTFTGVPSTGTNITGYAAFFGDGASAQFPASGTLTHTYTAAGTYNAELIHNGAHLVVVPVAVSARSTPPPPPPPPNTVQPSSVPTRVLSAIGGNSPLIDFLISDVCVDASDQPIKGDPATCSRHRDLKFGEFVPYLKTDWISAWNHADQASMSYPIEAPDGSLRIMHTMEYGDNSNIAFRDYDVFGRGDGFDVLEGNGVYAAAIATQDPGGYQPFWSPGCGNDDSWGLFPMDLGSGGAGNNTFKLNIAQTCPSTFNDAFTTWRFHSEPITYTSGKTLQSIYVEHYGGNSSDFHNIETFYFTKEYGLTRWESWTVDGPAQSIGICSGPTEKDFSGKRRYLWSCRDWSYTRDENVAINPLTNPMGGTFVFSRNLLVAGDFAQSNLGAWQRINNGNLITDWAFGKDAATGNSYLKFACWSGCNGNSIYQDVDVSSLRGAKTLRYGALLKATKPANASLTLHLFDMGGAHIKDIRLPVNVETAWKHVDSTYDWNFDAQPLSKVRFEVYIEDKSAEYAIDEAYVTPSTPTSVSASRQSNLANVLSALESALKGILRQLGL